MLITVGTAERLMPFCTLWVENTTKVFCKNHQYRWEDAGRPDLETFIIARQLLVAAVAATGLLKPIQLLVQTTTDFVAETEHPTPISLDLIGISEIARELGVSRQRAVQLPTTQTFPPPVVHPASGRLYTGLSQGLP